MLLVIIEDSLNKTSVQRYLVKSQDRSPIELMEGICEADLI